MAAVASEAGCTVEVFGGDDLVQARYAADFGGPGNDALSFSAPSLAAGPEARAAACTVLEVALKAIAERRAPAGLQLGCVPAEAEACARAVVEEIFPTLHFVTKLTEANLFVAPAGPDSAAAAAGGVAIAPAAGASAEWLRAKLGPRGYTPAYLDRLLAGGGAAVQPLVATAGGEPVGHVVQELTDLSVGALFVEESGRGRGIGSALLAAAAAAVQQQTPGAPSAAASLVECGHSPSERVHERAGWSQVPDALVWLLFLDRGHSGS